MSITEPHPQRLRWAAERITAGLPAGDTLVAHALVARSPGLEDQEYRRIDEFNPLAGVSKASVSDVLGSLVTDNLPNDGQQDAVRLGRAYRRWGRTLSGGPGSSAALLLAALRGAGAGLDVWAAVTRHRLLLLGERLPSGDRGMYGDAMLGLLRSPLDALSRRSGGPSVDARIAERRLRRLDRAALVAIFEHPRTAVTAEPAPPDPELRRAALHFADGSTLVVALCDGATGDALVAALRAG